MVQYSIPENHTVITPGRDSIEIFKVQLNSQTHRYRFKKILNPFKRCSYTFGCNNPNETVHLKFDRFLTESRYDYLIIGDPDAFENVDFDSDYAYLYESLYDYSLTGKALILDGSQPTGIWATATSIQNFDIYFFRMVFIVLSGTFQKGTNEHTLCHIRYVTYPICFDYQTPQI